MNGADHDFSASDLADDDQAKMISGEMRCRSPFDSHLQIHSNAQQHLQQHHHQQQQQQQQHQQTQPPPLDSASNLHVISASGGHIIAVANPALALSTTMTSVEAATVAAAVASNATAGQLMAAIKRERMSPGPCDM